MQNATTMKSGEDAPVPAAVSGAEAAVVAPEPDTVREAAPMLAPEPDTVSEAIPVVARLAPESAAMKEVEPEAAPQPVSIIKAATEEAPQRGAVVTRAPADGDGDGKSPSPAPVSPPTVTEQQIPVDPASLRRLGMVADEDSPLSAPSVLTEVVVQSPLLPPLRRPTFVGASLPCSAVSSPVHGGAGAKWEESNPAATPSPRSALSSLARQHSTALARLVSAPLALSRSATRAEGRTMAPHEDNEEPKALAAEDGSFTCGALCMLIPGFSKKKPAAGMAVSSMQGQPSRVASLERFECGSWSPPPPVKMAFVFDGEAPTRGILKNSASSRLSSARPSTSSQRHVRFSTATASCPSSPSAVVTPSARAEFNAFLEAQSA